MRNNQNMKITLTPEQNKAVETLVKAGLFASKDAAIVHYSLEGLKQDAAKLEALRAEIAIGIDQADRGEMLSLKEVAEQLKRDHEEQFGETDWSA